MNMNEVMVPLGSIAYLPQETHTKVDMLTLEGTDGAIHTRKVNAISVVPKKSMTIWTTNGDKLTWDANDDSAGKEILVELAEDTSPQSGDAVQWTMCAGCAACTATSIVADDSVVASIEEFYDEIIGVSPQGGRKLWGGYGRSCSSCL